MVLAINRMYMRISHVHADANVFTGTHRVDLEMVCIVEGRINELTEQSIYLHSRKCDNVRQ